MTMERLDRSGIGVTASSPISIEHVSKTYFPARRSQPPVVALDDIDFEIQPGEFLSLVGPSGCGKSTLLNIMGGLLAATDGVVTFENTPITGPRPEIGMMFQSPVLFPWRSIIKNVLLPIDVTKGRRSRNQYKARAHELLQRVGLEEFAESYPNELSGGMQQRAALARLLLQDPQVMLLDEPFGALDEFTREEMNIDLLRLWSGSAKTIVFVTHNILEAVFLSDRIAVMTPRPGRVAKVITSTLPRPREISLMKTAEFQDIAFEVRQLLGVD
jgi:NitT/TauT family transport system ATP-binding protein